MSHKARATSRPEVVCKERATTWDAKRPAALRVAPRRPLGFVGGLGQAPWSFGPFGLASRTPLEGLWLGGDAIHPGEGTAGVSQSALMLCQQLLGDRGVQLSLA